MTTKIFKMKDDKTTYCSKCDKQVNYCTDYVSDTVLTVKFCNECDERITMSEEDAKEFRMRIKRKREIRRQNIIRD